MNIKKFVKKKDKLVLLLLLLFVGFLALNQGNILKLGGIGNNTGYTEPTALPTMDSSGGGPTDVIVRLLQYTDVCEGDYSAKAYDAPNSWRVFLLVRWAGGVESYLGDGVYVNKLCVYLGPFDDGGFPEGGEDYWIYVIDGTTGATTGSYVFNVTLDFLILFGEDATFNAMVITSKTDRLGYDVEDWLVSHDFVVSDEDLAAANFIAKSNIVTFTLDIPLEY